MVILIVNTSEVESLKSAMAKAKKEVEEEGASCRKHEARLDEVQQELKHSISKCDSLERKISDRDSELAKALQSAKEARVEAQGVFREIQEARHIVAGKAFNMQSKFVRRRYILLIHVWGSP